jgi:hypothetical protein
MIARSRKIVFTGVKQRSARKDDNLNHHLQADCLVTIGPLISHNRTGLHGLLQEQIYLHLILQ